jgi:GNAT superfamily N-acetyltransferase
MALVVTPLDSDEIIALCRYDVDPATQLADIAFVVLDAWQRRGIGTLLMKRMSQIAHGRGLAGFSADVLATNALMMGVFHKSGLEVTTELDNGCYHLALRFAVAPRASAAPRGVPNAGT